MLRRRDVWGALALCAALALLLAPAALAQSAGNQQYVDPLASTTPTAPAATSSPPPASSSSPAPQTSSAPAAAPASASSSSPTSSSASGDAVSSSADVPAHSTGATLPFTGLDLWPAVAVGFGLIGSGLVLRRLARR